MTQMNEVLPQREALAGLGELLRGWRALRGLSQQNLALAAETTSRHLSFIESGRARASKEMILRLADVLEVPQRNRNALLAAGGYAQIYRETGLPDHIVAETNEALAAFLRDQEPFPASAMDHRMNFAMGNLAVIRTLRLMIDWERLWPSEPRGAPELLLSPLGLRPHIQNWPVVMRWLLGQIYREAHAGTGSPAAQERLEELLRIEGVASHWSVPTPDALIAPCIDVHLRRSGVSLHVRMMYLTLGSVEDIYLRHVRIIICQPADASTHKFLRWAVRRQRTLAEASVWKG